jgi:hypothetical protein
MPKPSPKQRSPKQRSPKKSSPKKSSPKKSSAKNSLENPATKGPRGGPRAAKSERTAGAPSLASLPLETITAELKRRQSEIPKLEARAKALRAELASVEARIAGLSAIGAAAGRAASGKPRAAKAPRPAASRAGGGLRARRNGQPTLAERIVALLADGAAPRSPREIAAALAASLGRPINQSFVVQISLTLRKLVNAGRISQPARAQYAAAPAAKGGAADAGG